MKYLKIAGMVFITALSLLFYVLICIAVLSARKTDMVSCLLLFVFVPFVAIMGLAVGRGGNNVN